MAEIVRVYHGSRGGLQGAIRPESDNSADFDGGFFDAKRLLTVYLGYHTLDCDQAIRRLKDVGCVTAPMDGRNVVGEADVCKTK